MFVLSTGKSSILTQFDNLQTKSLYKHANGEAVDFQFYSQQQVFVEINKKSGLEILRLKQKNNQDVQIQRVQKLTIENVFCVACAKHSLDQMALGLSNGQVQIYNYKNSEIVHRFKTDNNRNSVCFSDYNASDEYIASVFENGEISTYGIKTKTKLDTFKIDGFSTIARFHPSKRFHLGIASSTGAVTIYDVQAKKKCFHANEAHVSPCRDLCMTSSKPDTLITVGYDCLINVYDTRRKGQPLRINYCHPLSSVTISTCGNFICVGSLKGELISYDIRNTKTSLLTRKVHEGAVTRVAFVPNFELQTKSASVVGKASPICSQTLMNITEEAIEIATPSLSATYRDSFSDIIDYHANRPREITPKHFDARRSSFDWETLAVRKCNELTKIKLENTAELQTTLEYVNTKPRKPKMSLQPLCELPVNGNEYLHTPTSTKENISNHLQSVEKFTYDGDKENLDLKEPLTQNHSQFVIDKGNFTDLPEMGQVCLPILPGNNNSTPDPNNRFKLQAVNKEGSIGRKSVSETEIPIIIADSKNSDMKQAFADLRSEMTERIKELEEEIKFNAETNKWHIFTQNAKLWNQQNDVIEEVQEALALLLRADPFVNEFLRLKEENEKLHAQIKQIVKK